MSLDDWVALGGDVQLILFFTGLAVFLLLERLLRTALKRASRRRWGANLGLTALNLLTLGLLPVSLIGLAIIAQEAGWGLLNALALPAALVFVATLLLRGFVSWFTHRLMHAVPTLWRIHQVHHLDTELDVTTTARFHPLEFVVGVLIGGPWIVAFGLSPSALVAYEILDAAVVVFSHANVRLPDRAHRLLSRIIVTPNLHRIHHSSLRRETDSNFSAVFPLWDMVFGTYRQYPSAPLESMELGLETVRDERCRQLPWLLSLPFRRPLRRRGAAAVVAGPDALRAQAPESGGTMAR